MSSSPPTAASTMYFKRLIRNDYESRMKEDLDKLLLYCPDYDREQYLEEHTGFLKLYRKFISRSEKPIIWDEIQSFPRGVLLSYSHLQLPTRDIIKSLLRKLVVVKLNGGLGTTMKCDGPKCLIPVRNDLSFLDLSVQQIENLNAKYEANVPLVLMNSFNTAVQTEKMLKKYKNLRVKLYTFQQNCYPRIYSDTRSLLPTYYNDPDFRAWYPPGHGNFYEAFVKSGLIQKFIDDDREVCFVSNIDNLGAIVDFRILDLMTIARETPPPEFVMEVTSKTPADVKGGTLIHYMGHLKLLEFAEVPKEHIEEFKCSIKFTNFNTNNLWMKLDAITRIVTEDTLQLDVIPNVKTIMKDGSETEITQLETAAGAAIESFRGSVGLMVPRTRFLPVKTTSDLFLVRSNIFINDNGNIFVNSSRPYQTFPIISLSDPHFGDFRDIDKRFAQMPDCLQLHHLTICGNVYFGKDVVLKGNVTIVAQEGERIDIPRGSVLSFNIVTGSLKIVDF